VPAPPLIPTPIPSPPDDLSRYSDEELIEEWNLQGRQDQPGIPNLREANRVGDELRRRGYRLVWDSRQGRGVWVLPRI
jgi:hypothetical protein